MRTGTGLRAVDVGVRRASRYAAANKQTQLIVAAPSHLGVRMTNDPMPIEQIRIEPELRQVIKIEAAKDGVSVKEWVSKLIRAELDRRHIKVPK